MPNIEFITEDNLCFGENRGSISVERVTFSSTQEAYDYLTYILVWNTTEGTVSSDGRLITDLKNGTYGVKVVSTYTGKQSGYFYTDIESPPELKITNIHHSPYSCDDNGEISINISGGKPPYSYFVNGRVINSSNTFAKFTDLPDDEYEVTVIDDNQCSVDYNKIIIIQSSSISSEIVKTIAPKIYDGFGGVKLNITSNIGPFELLFEYKENPKYNFIVNFNETKYIESIVENIYTYNIQEKLYPGLYTLKITNRSNCSISTDLTIPNISPITVNIRTIDNNTEPLFLISEPVPIFDTVLIPYKHIMNNSDLWQSIKNYNLKDDIKFKINNNIYTFKIVRNILNKVNVSENEIEILKLGTTNKDWFFYFYIAPSINLNTNPEFINANIKLLHNNNEFDVTLGLTSDNNLDIENASLIRGSFILNGLGYNKYINGKNVYVYLNSQDDIQNYDHIVARIKKVSYKNMYTTDYVTILSFLEQFNVLNNIVGLNETSFDTDQSTYQYLLNIKNFLKDFNNFNYLSSIEISPTNSIKYSGGITTLINGQNIFLDDNNKIITNKFNIDYYTFNKTGSSLQQFYKGNSPIKDVTNITELKDGYIIVRISDLFNNKPKYVIIDNEQKQNYDNHYLSAKQTIQAYNKDIVNKFMYGDILAYIDRYVSIPQTPINSVKVPSIDVTTGTTNSSTLIVKTLPLNSKCYIYGPKNYRKMFIGETKFNNLIPGVYTIVGDNDYINQNNLYYNECKVLINQNSSETISIEFISYSQSITTKDV